MNSPPPHIASNPAVPPSLPAHTHSDINTHTNTHCLSLSLFDFSSSLLFLFLLSFLSLSLCLLLFLFAFPFFFDSLLNSPHSSFASFSTNRVQPCYALLTILTPSYCCVSGICRYFQLKLGQTRVSRCVH